MTGVFFLSERGDDIMGVDSDREKNMQLLGLIHILGDDYSNIYLVDRKTQQVEI